MVDFKKINKICAITVAFLLLAIAADKIYFSDLEWRYRTSKLSRDIEFSTAKANQLINETEARLASGRGTNLLLKEGIDQPASRDDILLLVYYKKKISYWSDNSVSFQPVYSDSLATKKMVFISNEWFIPVCRKSLDFDIVALIGIGKSYSIENDLLKTGFLSNLNLPESTGMSFDAKSSPFHVYTRDGKFNFAILFPDPKPNTFFISFPVLFWIGFFVALLLLINSIAGWMLVSGRKAGALLFSFLSLSIIYIVLVSTGTPESIHSTRLFTPFIYSSGKFLPSIGHLMVLSILLLNFNFIFFRYSSLKVNTEQKAKREAFSTVALLALAFIVFIAVNILFRSMIINSSVNYEAYKILDVNLISVTGMVSILLLLFIPMIILIRAYRKIKHLSVGACLFLTIIASSVLFIAPIIGSSISLVGLIFILGTPVIVLFWVRSSITLFNALAFYALLAGLYMTSVSIRYSNQKEDEAMKVMAVSIANDNDLVAESLLLDLWPSLEADTTLRRLMKKVFFTENDNAEIEKYLREHYFNGYWENYDFQRVICFDDSPLQLPLQSSYATNCFLYFDEKIKELGSQITGTGFYFINYNLGRASYLTRLYYDVTSIKSPGYVFPFITTGLFIELTSNIEVYQPGYPELLIDISKQRYSKLKGISYAKYSGDNLILRSGDYQYENRLLPVDFKGSEYQIVNKDKYKHLFYNRGDMTVVISKEDVSTLDRLITFAYLFIVTLFLTFVVVVLFKSKTLKVIHFDTYRRKLQLAFATVLITVFAIVIVAALFLSITKFTGNHSKLISEKIKSVSLAIESEMNQSSISDTIWGPADIPSLNSLLVNLSNVFLSDINLYSPSGELIATSRPEIFKKQLEGTRINTQAYGELMLKKRMEFIHDEQIGGLHYLSAYMPLYSNNVRSRLLGYVNLPYFRMQDLLAGEVSTVVVTVVNFTFLLLVLMMWIAVFISDRLTSPLQLLQRAMASVELGKKSEHLLYTSKDEVGDMVRQYNRMIDELDDSAKKLARSEREMAWREMARQIAHEIKNPLTPMKLNVQQLLRWWKDGAPDFNNRLETFTENQIECIDNLSSIATAFSNFARLPVADPSETDILAQLRSSIELFSQTDGIRIILDTGNMSKVVMMADKEHLNGIFSNLIKNAIQAIPTGRFGIIRITVSASFDKTLITFRDNGIGISEEFKPKMFTPNFTTKSSGMGLGLSIVKRYVETAGGVIWFESFIDRGTTFYIELPLLYTVDKLLNKDDVDK